MGCWFQIQFDVGISIWKIADDYIINNIGIDPELFYYSFNLV